MNGQADEVRRLKKEAGKLQLKLALSEQARERIENHLDKNNSLFKANIMELEAARADLEKQIVERKLAQEGLSQSLSFSQAVIESTTDGILVVSRNGKISGFNKKFQEIWRIPDDVIAKKDDDKAIEHALGQLKYPEVFLSRVRELYAKPEDESFDILEFTDGRVIERYSKPQKIKDEVVGRVWSFHDITERRLADEVKQEALSRLRKIASQVPGIVFQFRLRADGTSCVPYASDAIRDIYRLGPEEVREDASKVFAAVHPEDLDAHLASIQESARDLTPWRQEYRLKFGDEPVYWLFGNAIPQREADGSTLWHGFITDITERRTVEEITPDIFYVIDLQGNLQRWNRSLEKFCGLPPDQMKNRPCLDFVCEEDRPIVAGDIQKVLTDGSATNTYRFIRRDGALIPFHCNGTLILNSRGEPSGFAGFGRDISELQEKERLLRDAKNMAESATLLKDKFVMLVSHDLRSPIAMIPAALNILRDQLSGKLNEKQAKLLERSVSACEGRINMIDQLLDISRLQTGSIKLVRRFMDARLLAEQVVESLSQLAERKGVTLINETKERTRIHADYNLMYEVITNLVTNAIKFTRAGDTITIFSPVDNPGAIAVKDTGVGIPPHIIPNLFHHEVKTTTTGTAGERGTGLGLPFCKDIMDAHGGSLTVESEKGKGSVFCAVLPIRTPVALVVDDDEDQREILSLHMRGAGFSVVKAASGLEALDIIRLSRPDMLITDIAMPGMDGIELLTHLKEATGGKPPPAMAVTGSRDKLILEQAFYAGAADIVSKPFDENELIPRVNRLLMMESM